MNKKVTMLIVVVIAILLAGGLFVWWSRDEEETYNDNERQEATTEEVEAVTEEEEVDADNPYFNVDATRPIRGANTELHEMTVDILEEVFEEVKLTDASSNQTDWQENESLTYFVPRLITAEDMDFVRDGLEAKNIPITSTNIDEYTAELRYTVELDGKEFDGRMKLNLSDHYSWAQQQIELRFRHIY